MSSSSSSALNSNEHIRNWLDLPSDVTANILKRIGVLDILENAQKVCIAWRKICKDDPAMWRVIKMNDFSLDKERMCKQAVDRSQGQLVDITIRHCNDELLSYVANRSRQLRRLEIVFRHRGMLRSISESLMKFPFLEELNLYPNGFNLKKEFIETAGRYCPMLKTLKLNQTPGEGCFGDDNDVAIAIGKNLYELRHLELIGSYMSNTGLQVILDGCHHLEMLDLRLCLNIDLIGDLGKRCFKQIKSLKLPKDFLKGSPYSDIYKDELFEDDDDSLEGSPHSDIYEGELFENDDDPMSPPEVFDGYISE